MRSLDLEAAALAAGRAADLARREILSRFRAVSVEQKADGSPVTAADANLAVRAGLFEDAVKVLFRMGFAKHSHGAIVPARACSVAIKAANIRCLSPTANNRLPPSITCIRSSQASNSGAGRLPSACRK